MGRLVLLLLQQPSFLLMFLLLFHHSSSHFRYLFDGSTVWPHLRFTFFFPIHSNFIFLNRFFLSVFPYLKGHPNLIKLLHPERNISFGVQPLTSKVGLRCADTQQICFKRVNDLLRVENLSLTAATKLRGERDQVKVFRSFKCMSHIFCDFTRKKLV